MTTRLRSNLSLTLLALITVGSACSKTESAPTGFGVNVTVDATGLPQAERAMITTDKLTVVSDKAGSTPFVHVLPDLPKAIQSGTVRFHFTPPTGAGAGDQLSFVLDVLAGTTLIASGSAGPVTLATGAVAVTITLAGAGDGGTDGGKGNGTACVTNAECGTGFCADGVCCNEKCDDVCVSCNQAGSKGTCKEFAAESDPDLECSARIPVAPTETDAGTTTDGGSDASATADGSAGDALIINTPDGGFMSMPKACAGTCSGTRSCKYPGKTTSCGKAFCNTRKDIGAFVCDGNGVCNVDVSTTCSAYACDQSKGACFTACAGPADCEAGFYCGSTGQCLPKKVASVACGTDGECKTDHCSSGVCCNTACTGTGLSCNDPGQAGQCKCQGVNCAAGVACQIFYQDTDSDHFGNMNGSIAAGTAKAGCMGDTPPVGFVADNTDCDDSDANAHPGQTAFFAVQRKSGGFDYDCDTKVSKETPEYPNGVCKFCGAVGSCDQTSGTCANTSQTGSFQCPQEGNGGVIALSEPVSPASPLGKIGLSPWADDAITSYAGTVPGGAAILPPPICKVCFLQCCGCAAADKTGFRQIVDCGVSTVSKYTCGSCAAVPGAPSMTASFQQQRCR